MFTSSRLAPPSTWSRATETAASNWPFRIRRAKRREPVTLVRSPTTRKADSGRTRGSVPARRSREERAGGWRGRRSVHRAPDRADVVRGGAAAPADEVDEAVRREGAQRRGGDFRRLVIAAEFVR